MRKICFQVINKCLDRSLWRFWDPFSANSRQGREKCHDTRKISSSLTSGTRICSRLTNSKLRRVIHLAQEMAFFDSCRSWHKKKRLSMAMDFFICFSSHVMFRLRKNSHHWSIIQMLFLWACCKTEQNNNSHWIYKKIFYILYHAFINNNL